MKEDEDRSEHRGAQHPAELVGGRLQATRDASAFHRDVADDRLRGRGDDQAEREADQQKPGPQRPVGGVGAQPGQAEERRTEREHPQHGGRTRAELVGQDAADDRAAPARQAGHSCTA